MPSSVRSLFVVGNSYSATTPGTAPNAWPGMLSAGLGFAFIQANNVAWPGCQILSAPGHPGLMAQLARLPAGSKIGALLVIWLFPDLSKPLQPNEFIPVYTSGINVAYSQHFRWVLMPNLADITKTALYKQTYTRLQLAALRVSFANFNAAYNTMIAGFRSRHPDMKFATVDIFTLWDGLGTIADGFHPNRDTHRKFAWWFYNVIINTF